MTPGDTDLPPEARPQPATPPLIIGHRGDSAHAPENTLISFRRAMEAGADGIEFDVRLARDGVPVCIHDATLVRTAGVNARVDELTAAELADVDVGSWFNERHPANADGAYERERVPTLAAVCAAMNAYRKKILYVELKCDEREAEALARGVIEVVREHALENCVVVESFNLPAVAAVKSFAPGLRTAALFERSIRKVFPDPRGIAQRARECGADELALHWSLVTRRMVKTAHAASLPVVVWTIDAPRWVDRALGHHLRALITNRPALMRARLEQLRASRQPPDAA